ncbi:MAG TPA: tRNA (adenosine(37)-N6)-dimethylallyltransferase MiaA [Mollicutes bacterium]|jgi:tRNA dimethylallyltransferase|nr:tRNA (adenosine(37)-N6)-dimethylallyltransferase MiaA [Mollicutes bacterium]
MKKIIVITGPTGVGKTKLSIELAKHFDGEVINADSMQIYKDLNIGTAKISDEEKEGIEHHLFDIKEVDEDYSVYDYQRDGREILDNFSEDKTPIIVGGTGLYIKALLYDYEFYNNEEKYDLSHLTNKELLDEIKKYNSNVDIHINNRKRLERRLNIYLNNQSETDKSGDKLLYDVIFIGLTTDRKKLYDIINKRVDKMISDGLIDEVKAIYQKDIRSKSMMTGIGYKELYKYFDDEISLEEAIDLIKKNSRHYAKRQYTWFNNQMNITWFDVNFNNFDRTVEEVIDYIEKAYDNS